MPTNDGSFADIILATIIGKRQTLIAMGVATDCSCRCCRDVRVIFSDCQACVRVLQRNTPGAGLRPRGLGRPRTKSFRRVMDQWPLSTSTTG